MNSENARATSLEAFARTRDAAFLTSAATFRQNVERRQLSKIVSTGSSPVSNRARPTTFYGAIFDTTLKADPAMPGYEMAMFPSQGVN